MIRKNQVLTREADCIPLVCRRRTATQEDCLTIAGIEMPVSMSQQSWIFEVTEETCAGRTTPGWPNTLAQIVKWLSHLGSGKIDESLLESRHSIHHNFKINGIGC
jgi:hypothetical protein